MTFDDNTLGCTYLRFRFSGNMKYKGKSHEEVRTSDTKPLFVILIKTIMSFLVRIPECVNKIIFEECVCNYVTSTYKEATLYTMCTLRENKNIQCVTERNKAYM